MTDLIKKAREKLAFDEADWQEEAMEYCGPNLHNAPTWPVRERAFLAGARRENARTRAIVDALLKVAEAAENLERQCKLRGPFKMKDLSDAGDAMTKALRELSQAVGDDPAQKGG